MALSVSLVYIEEFNFHNLFSQYFPLESKFLIQLNSFYLFLLPELQERHT